MRRKHMTRALVKLREANVALGDARDWLFDLEHMPLRHDLAEVKGALQALTVQLQRQRDRETSEGE
jgi:hypothetical protein